VIKFVSDLQQVGGWFSQGTLVSFTNKSDRHHKTEILLKAGVFTPNSIRKDTQYVKTHNRTMQEIKIMHAKIWV
jgi:hypothetical protein